MSLIDSLLRGTPPDRWMPLSILLRKRSLAARLIWRDFTRKWTRELSAYETLSCVDSSLAGKAPEPAARAGRPPPSQPSFYAKTHKGAVGRRGHNVCGPLSWRKNCKSKPIDRRDFLIWRQLRFLLFLPFRACYVRSPSLETLLHDDLP